MKSKNSALLKSLILGTFLLSGCAGSEDLAQDPISGVATSLIDSQNELNGTETGNVGRSLFSSVEVLFQGIDYQTNLYALQIQPGNSLVHCKANLKEEALKEGLEIHSRFFHRNNSSSNWELISEIEGSTIRIDIYDIAESNSGEFYCEWDAQLNGEILDEANSRILNYEIITNVSDNPTPERPLPVRIGR